jgi:hypothetical protein
MAGAVTVPADLASSTGIEQHLRSREELAEQLALLQLEGAAAAARAWWTLRADEPAGTLDVGEDDQLERLLERFERVTGRPLAAACPAGCSCRGVPVA